MSISIRCESTREEIAGVFFAIKMKAPSVGVVGGERACFVTLGMSYVSGGRRMTKNE